MNEIAVQWESTEVSLQAKVLCCDGKHSVAVSRDPDFGSRGVRPAQVNWSGMGDRSPDVAEQYGRAIVLAAKVAREMDGPVFVFGVSFEFQMPAGDWKARKLRRLGNSIEQVRQGFLGAVWRTAGQDFRVRNVLIEKIGEGDRVE